MKTLKQYIVEAARPKKLDPKHQKVVDFYKELEKLNSNDVNISYYVDKKGLSSGCNIEMYYDLKDDYINLSYSIKYDKSGAILLDPPYIGVYGGNNHSVAQGVKLSVDFSKIVPNWKPSGVRTSPAKKPYLKVNDKDLDVLKEAIERSFDNLKPIADEIGLIMENDYDNLYAAAEEKASKVIAACKSVEDFRQNYADSGVGRGLVGDSLRNMVAELLGKDSKLVNAMKKFL